MQKLLTTSMLIVVSCFVAHYSIQAAGDELPSTPRVKIIGSDQQEFLVEEPVACTAEYFKLAMNGKLNSKELQTHTIDFNNSQEIASFTLNGIIPLLYLYYYGIVYNQLEHSALPIKKTIIASALEYVRNLNQEAENYFATIHFINAIRYLKIPLADEIEAALTDYIIRIMDQNIPPVIAGELTTEELKKREKKEFVKLFGDDDSMIEKPAEAGEKTIFEESLYEKISKDRNHSVDYYIKYIKSPKFPLVNREGTIDLSNIGLKSLHGLNQVPDIKHVKMINLNNNQLSEIPANSFQGFINVEIISLSNNQIKSLPATIFDCCPKLREIWLDGNQLTTIPDLKKLSHLRKLSLNSNKIDTIDADTFVTTTLLEELELTDNNINTLPATVFDPLVNLRTLHLDDNKLESIPDGAFDSLSNLKGINLERNFLSLSKSEFIEQYLSKIPGLKLKNIRYKPQLQKPGSNSAE